MRQNQETEFKITGEKGQWIDLQLLEKHLDHYVSYTRVDLIPIVNKQDSELFEVRFFDRRGHEYLGPDVIAELNKTDARMLNSKLDTLARELRQKNSNAQQLYKKITIAETLLTASLEELDIAHELVTNPIKGSCKFCQNERFWNKEEITSFKKELEQIPQSVYQKNNEF